MRGFFGVTVLAVLAIAGNGCACFSGLSPCVGERCPSSAGSAGLFGCGIGSGSCGPSTSDCSDCGTAPCACDAGPSACQSCAAPAFALCKPNLFRALFGCTGCDGEYYWSEWFSDPPACCDPCDEYGNWTGHGYGQGAGFTSAHFQAPTAGHAVGRADCPCGKH